MRPQQILDFLNLTFDGAFRIRCTSGAEYLIHDQSQWWFMRDERVLMIVVDATSIVALDPMLVESIIASGIDELGGR